MDVIDLTAEERDALYVALAHLAAADGRISDGELAELTELADEMGVPDLRDRVSAAHAAHGSIEALEKAVASVERDDARELIRTLLFDLAQADGNRDDDENDVLDIVTRVWARN